MKNKIMVVDDSRVVLAEMKKMLVDTDFEIVHYCRNGEEAIEAYEAFRPDLTTMDIVMPGMDGLETARQLLQRWPDAKLLMVSSLAYDDTIAASEAVGAKGFLFKPFTREVLVEGMTRVLAEAACEEGHL